MAREGRTVVVLGVTGSIAAYKAAELASQLTQSGAEVRTIMTRAGTKFVSPLTFQALTGRPVGVDIFEEGKGSKIEHIAAARQADLVLIAPATANVLGKLASGIADDLLTATVLATTAPVIVAPAMNPAMWANPAVQANVARLRSLGFEIIEPERGALACGESGKGRMAEPARIFTFVRQWRSTISAFKGVRFLVTAGPTREPLDAVRYISNPSSGKTGFALAREAKRRGAEVVLVTGPTELPDPSGIEVIRVVTGEEMRRAVLERAAAARVLIKSAAVTDYRPRDRRPGKTKEPGWDLSLEKIGNILEEVPREGKVIVGFAAEAGPPDAEAARKLGARGLDLVVANDITQAGGGFGSDANQATLHYADGRSEPLPLLPKAILAQKILDAVEQLLSRPPVEV